jgi:hypothetical protein
MNQNREKYQPKPKKMKSKEAIQQQAEAAYPKKYISDVFVRIDITEEVRDAFTAGAEWMQASSPAPVGEAPQADALQFIKDYWCLLSSDMDKLDRIELTVTPHQLVDMLKEYAKEWGKYVPEASNTDEAAVVTPHSSSGNSVEQGENGDPWISVKDRLPYKDGDSQIFCIVWDTREGIAVLPYNEYHKCWDGEDADDFYTDATEGNITHWQPLPQPPKSK